ncbi:hypothetical protein Syun_012196 [Stephania yunnanensis]|uniref:Uncharacterized protein n=1 Tax=Stephania yunnanensis TaxID=152371 RepID=A0AAP0PJ92_9MAGN
MITYAWTGLPRQLRYTEDKGTTHLPAIHGGLLKPDVVEESLEFALLWDLTETSKRDDGIDLLKDNQALQRLTGTAEKAKMDLSSLTQTNIRMVEVIWRGPQLVIIFSWSGNTWLVQSNGAHNSVGG